MSRYLVTGGAGFIGSHLVDALIKRGHDVIVVDNLSTGKRKNVNKDARLFQIDISDSANIFKLAHMMFDCDGVFHLAALTSVQASIEQPEQYNKVNINGTFNVLKCANIASVRRVVFSSSAAVYGDVRTFPTDEKCDTAPISPYGLQKLVGEQYCRLFSRCYNLETVSLRYFNVYGDRQSATNDYCSVIKLFDKQKQNNEPVTIVGDGEQRRDFIHVDDVVNANLLAMSSVKTGYGECINIGSGKIISINQIAKLFSSKKKHIAARQEPRISQACIAKAKRLLSWLPTILVEDWIKENKL